VDLFEVLLGLLGRSDAYMPGWIMSIAGALILLWLYRKFGRRAAP